MKKLQSISASVLVIALGAAAAVVAAPLFHSHGDPSVELSPMWANPYQSLGEMTQDADAVVLAQVARTGPSRLLWTSNGNNPLPFTMIDLDVEEVVHGSAPDVVLVEQTGGVVGDRTIYVDGDQAYSTGDRVLLFLKASDQPDVYYVSHPKGRFEVDSAGTLMAVTPDPVSLQLDGLTLGEAKGLIRAAGLGGK
jgi:hypothetical protein